MKKIFQKQNKFISGNKKYFSSYVFFFFFVALINFI